MKDDYLWDKSGEPDREIQQLEDALSTFRYQPRPLEIPQSLQIHKSRFFMPASIAAAIGLLVLGAGLWIAMTREHETPVVESRTIEVTIPATPQPTSTAVASNATNEVVDPKPERKVKRSRHLAPARSEMTAAERAEAERAKQQLFIALRLASSKLNQAQKRTQGAPARLTRYAINTR